MRLQRNQYGDRFNASALAPKFAPFFRTGQRIKVDFGYAVKTGTVGVTTGWCPSFLLMLRSSDIGSSWLLSQEDEIVAVKKGREYVPATALWHNPNEETRTVEVPA